MEAAANPMDQRILLAVDQSRVLARTLLEEAIKRARDDGADLIVLSVVEPHNLHLPGGLRRRVDQERDRLAAGALAIVRAARDAGVQATFLIWEGRPGGGDPRGLARGRGRRDRARVAAPDEPPPAHPRQRLVAGREAGDLRGGRGPGLTGQPTSAVPPADRAWNASPSRSAEPPSSGIRSLTAPGGRGR